MSRLLVLILGVLATGPVQAQGSVLLIGGGGYPPDAMEWFVDQSPSGRVLLLDYENNQSARTVAALEAAGAVVQYLPVPDSVTARDARVLSRVKSATLVFLPGGDQWKYVSQWRGTPLTGAIRFVLDRGGAVGGTSAGAMILGEVVYDARNGGASSLEIEADPFGPDAAVTVGFLDIVPDALVDTHVGKRDRVRRMAVFLNRARAESGQSFSALGLDEGTALAIGPDRIGTVYGVGALTLLVQCDSLASVGSFQLARLRAGQRLDLSDGSRPVLLDLSTEWSAYPLPAGDASKLRNAVPPPRARPLQPRRVGW